jgi:hypothetical protein
MVYVSRSQISCSYPEKLPRMFAVNQPSHITHDREPKPIIIRANRSPEMGTEICPIVGFTTAFTIRERGLKPASA